MARTGPSALPRRADRQHSCGMAARTGDFGKDIQAVERQDRLGELSADECRYLLASANVGRIAWNSPDGPRVLPVNFRWDDGQLVFRTSPYGELAQLVRRQPVAFQADDIDSASRTGCSVVVYGEAASSSHHACLTCGAEMWSRPGRPGVSRPSSPSIR
jgi:hypothetical protein